MNAAPRRVRIERITRAAATIRAYELVPLEGELPAAQAGAHIDVRLPNGLVRSYSLLNPGETRRYVIAVHRDPASRGGSALIHERLAEGDTLEISAPRNNFPLREGAHSVLIAGGIGITPLRAMIRQLGDRSWKLYYCARSPEVAAFREELERLPQVVLHFDEGVRFLDLARVVAEAPEGSHFYCCGPASMLEAFAAATAHLPRERVHTESFAGVQDKPAGGFTVVLAKSGLTLTVPEGSSILDTVLEAGVDIAYSCTEGVCGSCETRVLEGVPEHRDQILSEAERAAGATMMICCSGSRSGRLVLDL